MDDDLSIPSFLKRDKNNESEVTRMSVSKETAAPAKAKAAPPVAAKAAPAKAANGAAGKPTAPAKAVKVASKAKPEVKAKAPKKEAAKRDAFGFREGSLKSKAATLYAAKGGATLAEVKTATGSVQLNLLTSLESKGFAVTRKQEAGEGKRSVTRYFLKKK